MIVFLRFIILSLQKVCSAILGHHPVFQFEVVLAEEFHPYFQYYMDVKFLKRICSAF